MTKTACNVDDSRVDSTRDSQHQHFDTCEHGKRIAQAFLLWITPQRNDQSRALLCTDAFGVAHPVDNASVRCEARPDGLKPGWLKECNAAQNLPDDGYTGYVRENESLRLPKIKVRRKYGKMRNDRPTVMYTSTRHSLLGGVCSLAPSGYVPHLATV